MIKFLRLFAIVAFILMLPLLAMQITDEVVWDLTDFAVAGALLVSIGLTYELVARKMESIAYRAAVGIMLAAALLIVWIVLAVGIIGAIIARFQPYGMSRALFTTTLAQALVAVITLIKKLGYPASPPLDILILNGFFVALFLGSALLFRKAALEQTAT